MGNQVSGRLAMNSALRWLSAGLAFLLVGHSSVQAQQLSGTGVFSCMDARGRTLTSDRPISDCIDREQRELRRTGGVLRRIEPTYTEVELAEREERARQARQSAARQLEVQRRERALLVRYPTATAHDRERAAALAPIEASTRVAKQYLGQLINDRDKIAEKLEFYKGHLPQAPEGLRLKREDNEDRMQAQVRFINGLEAEMQMLSDRFDQERMRLMPFWRAGAMVTR